MDCERKFSEELFGRSLAKAGDHILIALSGGSDSMFLLHMLKAASQKADIAISAFHLNHMLRPEAQGDELFVINACESLGVSLITQKSDIRLLAERKKLSIEEAGREERYRLLRQAAEKLGANLIATAHHADDNAETVLMRIIRGTGVRGLVGIKSRNGNIIRPMLAFTKEEILSCLEASGISYRQDESNFDSAYLRNRIRNTLLPLIKQENPKAVSALNRLSASAASYEDYISASAGMAGISYAQGCALASREKLRCLSGAVLESVVWQMASHINGARDLSAAVVLHVCALIRQGASSWAYSAPGAVFECSGDIVSASRDGFLTLAQKPVSFNIPLVVGSMQLLASSGVMVCSQVAGKAKKNWNNNKIMLLNYDKMDGKNLALRSRIQGDVFQPLGMPGKKTLKKFFIDEKIPEKLRDRVPIFTCGGEIALVGNYRIDDRFKVQPDTKNVLAIQIEYLEKGNGLQY